MDQPTFNLSALVRVVADELDTPDPHLIAAEVLTRIDPDDLATALAHCLPDYVSWGLLLPSATAAAMPM